MVGKPREKKTSYKDRELQTNSKEDLEFLYHDEKLSAVQIGEMFGVSRDTILRRMKRFGLEARDFKGENNPMWSGGIKYENCGYVLIWNPEHPYANSQGYVREHRLVIEKHIGRILEPDEVVHHINKDRTDNRIENLQLLKDNSSHAKLESEFRMRDSAGRFL